MSDCTYCEATGLESVACVGGGSTKIICRHCHGTMHMTPPMNKPPLNTYIEWDGSEAPPVPEGTDVTVWTSCNPTEPLRANSWGPLVWTKVTAYLVHAYPKEDEVVEAWVYLTSSNRIGLSDAKRRSLDLRSIAHIRFVNGVAEIVSQEKA